MKLTSADVARYYDANTASFLRRGQGGGHGAIHRAVWGEGVRDRRDAFDFVHALLRREMEIAGASRVLDLGCGTGAGLEAVLTESDVTGFGVTNSAVHARLARERLGDRATIMKLDFCSEPLPRDIDLAFGIESFVHAPDASAFFDNVARSLGSKARVVLCDDFLAGAREDRAVRAFRHGWRLSSLMTPRRVDAVAAAHGLTLVDDRDLTPFLELDRRRDRVLGAIVALGRPVFHDNERWLSLSGGHALRQCLVRGSVHYRYRVWSRA